MARKRRFGPNSPTRYQWKMARLYGPSAPQALVLELVDKMKDEWLRGFGEYHNAWQALLRTIPPDTPPMRKARLKAALNYFIRKKYQGFRLDLERDHWTAIGSRLFDLTPDEVNAVIDAVLGLGI